MESVADGNESGIVFDRSRITHGESKQVAVMSMRLQQAQKAMDADKVEACLDAIDVILAKMVVAVPADWLPKGIDMGTEKWLDALSQDRYEEIMAMAQPSQPGEKKA